VVYTGTHDNDTTSGWAQQLSDDSKHYICDYLGCNAASLPWGLIRAAMASTRWRFSWDQVPVDLSDRVQHLVRLYGRAPS